MYDFCSCHFLLDEINYQNGSNPINKHLKKWTEVSVDKLVFLDIICSPASHQTGRRCHHEAGCWQASGSDPCMDLSENAQVTAQMSNEPITHMCQILAYWWSYGSTAGSRWRESLSSRWSLRLDPSLRTLGCCCHWRRDEEGWQSHRRCWWLRRSLGSHRGGGETGGEWSNEMKAENNCGHIGRGEKANRQTSFIFMLKL